MQRFLSAAFAAFAFTAPAIAAVPVGGPQPLVDRNLIRSSAGLHRVIGAPVKAAAPIVDGASDHNHTPYLSVIHENGRFRLWYAAKLSDSELRLGYTTSADGIRFGARRMLPLPAGYQWGASIIRRQGGYFMPYYAKSLEDGSDDRKGLGFARSSDGLAWEATNTVPMFQPGDVGMNRAPGDITSVIRFRGRYLLFVKMNGTGFDGVTPHMPFPGAWSV